MAREAGRSRKQKRMVPNFRKRIAYYITPHGFGHAVRSLEIIRTLLDLRPKMDILLVTDLPEFLVEQNIGRMLPMRRKCLDVGLVQLDSLRFDLDASLEALTSLFRQRNELVAGEVEFLNSHGVECVVSDISFLAFAASRQVGIPGIGISNFTWDWIYEHYARTNPQWLAIVAWIRECYGKCDLFLQLPMHGDCSACPLIEDVPLVARKAKRSSREVRRVLDLRDGEKSYLISFAALELSEEAQCRIESMNATFFYKQPLCFHFSNGRSLDNIHLTYPDVVAAVDGVITKPGYGIVADSLAHGAPIIYTDRGDFPEYPVLVEEMNEHLTTVYMPSEALYSGNWEPFLRDIESRPRRVPGILTNGALVCAEAILARLE